MSWVSALVRLFSGAKPLPETHAPPPPGIERLHVFAGHFDSEAEAMAYVFEAPDANHPEPFTNDLPDAFVNTDFVEVSFGPRADAAASLIAKARLGEFRDRMDDANTLIIASEQAFGGFPFDLNDTPRARYIGAWEVGK